MAGMERTQLLRAVRDTYPEVDRVILSGQVVLGPEALPPLPRVYQRLVEAVEKKLRMEEIARILEGDVALATRVMQVACSAFYGHGPVGLEAARRGWNDPVAERAGSLPRHPRARAPGPGRVPPRGGRNGGARS